MIALEIAGANVRFTAPEGWNEATQGECYTLPVRVTQQPAGEMYCESAWELTAEELGNLIRGGRVVLRIVGAQPPVALWVEPHKVDP